MNNYKKYFLNDRVKIINSSELSKDLVNNILIKSGIYYNDKFWFINKITIIAISIIIIITSYIFFINLFKLKILTIIFSFTLGLLPIYCLKLLEDQMNSKIEKEIINFIVKLKAQININNDLIKSIIEIVKYLEKPINIYFEKFSLELDKGVSVEQAFTNLKSRINNREYNNLISNIENCYNYGGDVITLLNRSQNIFNLCQKERVSRNEQTLSGRIVLVILVILMIFVFFNFIRNNEENFNIMINNIGGQIILYWNFISIWLMLFLIILVKKMDE